MKWFLVPSIFLAGMLCYQPFAQAQARQATQREAIAESLFIEGKKLMRQKKFEEACDKFSASHQIDPALGTLLNLAVCLEKMGKTASAWSKYSDVIARAKIKKDKSRESYARKRLKKLEPQLLYAKIVVSQEVTDLIITLDGNVLPRQAWGTALPVDPGAHQLEAQAKGRITWSATMQIGAEHPEQEWEVPFLEKEPVAVAPSLPVAEKASVVQTKQKLFWGLSQKKWGRILDGSGAALLIGGLVFDAMAAKAYSEAKNTGDVSVFDNAKRKFRTRAAMANILYATGVVALGAGLYFTFYGSPNEGSPVSVTVTPHHSGGSLVLSGEF